MRVSGDGEGDDAAEALLSEEDDIEAGLLAELDEEDAAQAGPSSAAPASASDALLLQQQRRQQQRQQQSRPQQPPPPQQRTVTADQALPIGPDGFVELDRLTVEQRNKVTHTIVGLMTEEQLDRYEAFRRSSLKRPMRQLVKVVTNSSANPNDKLMIAVSSVAKSFVGDLVETARLVATQRGDEGPLQPLHIHVAYQQLKDQGKVPGPAKGGQKKRPFL